MISNILGALATLKVTYGILYFYLLFYTNYYPFSFFAKLNKKRIENDRTTKEGNNDQDLIIALCIFAATIFPMQIDQKQSVKIHQRFTKGLELSSLTTAHLSPKLTCDATHAKLSSHRPFKLERTVEKHVLPTEYIITQLLFTCQSSRKIPM